MFRISEQFRRDRVAVSIRSVLKYCLGFMLSVELNGINVWGGSQALLVIMVENSSVMDPNVTMLEAIAVTLKTPKKLKR